MSTSVKQSVAATALAALFVWPAIHFTLTQTAGVDPWKLCGWAMYARPRRAQQLALMELRDGATAPIREISDAAREELRRVSASRAALGALQSMESFGRLLLDERPDADGVRVVVRTIAFDCATARVDDVTDQTYDYARSTDGG